MSMSPPEQLRPLALYEAMYAAEPRRFAMPTTTDPAAWDTWRVAFRARLRERLGGLPTEQAPARFTAAPPTTHNGYQRTYIEYESAPSVIVPAWLLVPTELTIPAPAVIAVHGHGYGVDDVVGINADGTERSELHGYHQNFALALCRRGMIVLAPELRGFGRRREPQDQAQSPETSSCRAAAWWGIMLGKPLLGSRVWDVLRGIDLLQQLGEVNPQRIGIMGISGGGAVALLAAALDQRLQAAVISGYFCTFRDSILALQHCACNYVPGLLADAEMYDIAGLIAPRPLLIEAGTEDHIFPLPGVLEAYERVHTAYAALGATDRIDKDVFAGGHQINGVQAYPFLRRWLTLEA
jgi:dienelactone hydrolase